MLGLKVIPPDGGPAVPMSVDKVCTGLMLKERVQYITKALPEDQSLFFQAVSAAEQIQVDDDTTLEVQGVRDGAEITVSRARTAPASSSGYSIARHGRLSYYHSHRTDPRFDSGQDVQAGGQPVRLEVSGGIANVVRIDKYTWADDGKAVKVFIEAEQDPRALKAAGDGRSGKVDATFQEGAFRLTVTDETRTFVLNVPKLHREIAPQECKVRVSEGKRITVTLKKREPEWTWFALAEACRANAPELVAA